MIKKFSRIYIEITNICNLSCSFCIGNVRTPRFVTVDEFSYIIQQAKPYTNHIYLHVLGEPLLHPQLKELLAVAHHFDMQVNITTNGTLLAKTQEILLNAPALRKISISLHSMEPNSPYQKEEYLAGVASFVTQAATKGIFCDLRLWNLGADDVDNEAIFISLCRLLGLDYTAQETARLKINESGNTTLMPRIFLGKAARFTWPSMAEPRTEQPIFCHGLRSQVAVLSDGTIVPCCLDSQGDIALGNIFQLPLTQILSSERAQALYNGFSARQPSEELCRRCGYATRF
ncbi:radical SAM/SPASM domain-containing protein [Scatolibacter rhodanostii]|uniref:radical SAM/SPASM domain-containing protein n=1 Tax=Scatolibacter rhodanostii TaxID=2014781 RepID=UPI000C07DBD1|nr:radical SAM/SPASM domain-containing protein [Scatolibacter rhodanostii]